MSDYVELPNKKPFLSLILLREGVLTDQEGQTALREWALKRESGQVVPFGQVVLSLGYMQPYELEPYLQLQRKLATAPSAEKPLGRLLIENAILRPSQVQAALMLQERTGQLLGELLLEEGVLRQPQLDVLLRFQKRHRMQANQAQQPHLEAIAS